MYPVFFLLRYLSAVFIDLGLFVGRYSYVVSFASVRLLVVSFEEVLRSRAFFDVRITLLTPLLETALSV